MQQKKLGLMQFLFGSSQTEHRAERTEHEPSCSDWVAGPEPEGEQETAAASAAAAAAAAAAAPAAAAAARPARGIPVPNIADASQSAAVPIQRVEMIVGRSLCDVHSDEAERERERANSPVKMGQTPPLLSIIRQTVIERERDSREAGMR